MTHLTVYLAVPYVYFSVHSSKKRFHFIDHGFVFWKKWCNFLGPIPISTHNIATKESTPLFWEIKVYKMCVSKCFSMMYVNCLVNNAMSAASHHNTSFVQLFEFPSIRPGCLENWVSASFARLTLYRKKTLVVEKDKIKKKKKQKNMIPLVVLNQSIPCASPFLCQEQWQHLHTRRIS